MPVTSFGKIVTDFGKVLHSCDPAPPANRCCDFGTTLQNLEEIWLHCIDITGERLDGAVFHFKWSAIPGPQERYVLQSTTDPGGCGFVWSQTGPAESRIKCVDELDPLHVGLPEWEFVMFSQGFSSGGLGCIGCSFSFGGLFDQSDLNCDCNDLTMPVPFLIGQMGPFDYAECPGCGPCVNDSSAQFTVNILCADPFP